MLTSSDLHNIEMKNSMRDKEIAIAVDGISKIYRIGLKEEADDNFVKASINFIKSPLSNFRKHRSLYKFDDVDLEDDSAAEIPDVLRALRNLSFQVKRGEVVGIIGANGAGKSTLLKILCKITKPTSGRAEINGRVSSLLEVGTGFHAELTGRENIYLNGTILGMRKLEIDAKFKEIVEFSGVRKFIDTPVKRYSSGMKVRLAFSVAAYLEPEILIVDEVLAVGDADFQKRCLNKMDDVGKSGRTVLFVSHNMQAMARLCSRCILLERGSLVDDGPSEKVISRYLNSELGTSAAREWDELESSPGNEVAKLRAIRVISGKSEIAEYIDINQPFRIEMEYDVIKPGVVLLPNFHVYNEQGVEAFAVVDLDPAWRQKKRPKGRYVSAVEVPENIMAEGVFSIKAVLHTLNPLTVEFTCPSVASFTIIDKQDGTTARGDYVGKLPGVMRPKLTWKTDYSAMVEYTEV